MAMLSSRPIDVAVTTYFDHHVKATLDGAEIPVEKQNAMKAEVTALIAAIVDAVLAEITANAETVVTTDVESIITAIKGGSPTPQDGGAVLKSTIVAGLPTTISGKIK